MAFSKTEEFSEETVYLADIAKAVSHPARVQIIKILSGRQCICGDLVEILPLAQATVSQHLKELKRAGIIKGIIQGPKTCYCLNEKSMQKIQKAFEKFFAELNLNNKEACDE